MLIWIGAISLGVMFIALKAPIIGIPLLLVGIFAWAFWEPKLEPPMVFHYPVETPSAGRELHATENIAYTRDEQGRTVALRHRHLMWRETSSDPNDVGWRKLR